MRMKWRHNEIANRKQTTHKRTRRTAEVGEANNCKAKQTIGDTTLVKK